MMNINLSFLILSHCIINLKLNLAQAIHLIKCYNHLNLHIQLNYPKNVRKYKNKFWIFM